ncbi:hypothetical protein Taro_044427 [Colocasia esculenta]|uniref:Uncharacterized protein n=1 Tax=Colocasia esculenta TaxID=4460 RepID=A0A843X5G2_COLES|nr:hypothetical protein [Colocasia esculenta]
MSKLFLPFSIKHRSLSLSSLAKLQKMSSSPSKVDGNDHGLQGAKEETDHGLQEAKEEAATTQSTVRSKFQDLTLCSHKFIGSPCMRRFGEDNQQVETPPCSVPSSTSLKVVHRFYLRTLADHERYLGRDVQRVAYLQNKI